MLRPLPVPRPLPLALLNLALEGAAILLGWSTRVDYAALVFALACLPLSVIVLFSIVRDLDAYPYPCPRRTAALAASVLWLIALVPALGMLHVMTGRTPLST
jgi:hypothetical protein